MHPSDATLLALVQGELAPDEGTDLSAHLAQCERCVGRADELRRDDEDMAELLGLLDNPMPGLEPPITTPRARPFRHAAIAAAAALFVAGVAAASVPGTPVYRWIRDRIDAPRGEVPGPAPAPAAATPAQAAGGLEMAAPSALIVQFTAEQPGGVLTVAAGSRPVVSLRAFGGAVAYRVGAGRLVVDNSHPANRYALEIPAELGRLTITLGGRVIYHADTAAALRSAGPDTISLTPGSAQ